MWSPSAFAIQQCAPSGKFLQHQGSCRLLLHFRGRHSLAHFFVTTLTATLISMTSAPLSNFFIITEVQRVSVASTASPWKSEAQFCRGSPSKCLSSLTTHFSLSTYYLCTLWNSLLPLLIVNYH